jgi:hypothetical protein
MVFLRESQVNALNSAANLLVRDCHHEHDTIGPTPDIRAEPSFLPECSATSFRSVSGVPDSPLHIPLFVRTRRFLKGDIENGKYLPLAGRESLVIMVAANEARPCQAGT